MGIKNNDYFPVSYSFIDKERMYEFGKQIFVNSLRFLGKEQAIFTNGESIKIELNIYSKISMNDIQMVLRIKDFRNIEKIATSLSNPFKVNEGQNIRITFDFYLNELIEDKYNLSIEIIKMSSAGNYYAYDNPGVACPIEIVESDISGRKWSKQYWGNVRMRNIGICDIVAEQ